MVLGQNNWISEVSQVNPLDMMVDVRYTYFCDGTTFITATLNAKHYAEGDSTEYKSVKEQLKVRKVDPLTCNLINPDDKLDAQSEKQKKELGFESNQEYFAWLHDSGYFAPILLTLFSMKVATSFIAAYTPMLFYTAITYYSFSYVRMLLWSTWRGYTNEVLRPVPMIKLCEYVHIMRHEENLIEEEISYRMLVEIIRQP